MSSSHTCRETRSLEYILYVEDAEEGADFQSRMFAPLHGVFEDPATGSANVALIGLLAHLRREVSLHLKATIGQGIDLGRPSMLHAVAEKVDGIVTATFIGGGCKPVMSGSIDISKAYSAALGRSLLTGAHVRRMRALGAGTAPFEGEADDTSGNFLRPGSRSAAGLAECAADHEGRGFITPDRRTRLVAAI